MNALVAYNKRLNVRGWWWWTLYPCIHCREEGCIGKYIQRGDFAPRDCHWNLEQNLLFKMSKISNYSPLQCTGILLELEVKYWFCGVTTDGAGVSQCFNKSWPTIFIRFCLSYICFIWFLQPLCWHFACLWKPTLCLSTRGCVPDIHPRECIEEYWKYELSIIFTRNAMNIDSVNTPW